MCVRDCKKWIDSHSDALVYSQFFIVELHQMTSGMKKTVHTDNCCWTYIQKALTHTHPLTHDQQRGRNIDSKKKIVDNC